MIKKDNSECRLCGIQSNLRESHIIPRSLVKPIFKETNTLMTGNFKDMTYRKQMGSIWDYLFCDLCESKIGIYESYGVPFMKGLRQKLKVNESYTILNIDYRKFKLFFLSIFYRMSISDRYGFETIDGKVIRLGKPENEIKKMLLNDNPEAPTKYGFYIENPIFKYEATQKIFDNTFSVFQEKLIDGFIVYIGYLLGYNVIFIASGNSLEYQDSNLFPQSNNTLIILNVRKSDEYFFDGLKNINNLKPRKKV